MEEYLNTSGKSCLSILIDNNIKAFTIVELIVVITILAILGTIGFISFSIHLVGTRDTNRLEQLSSIYKGLDTYSTQEDLPIPENYVEVRSSGSLIGYQGYVGKNILGQIGYNKGGKDPKDEQSFSYYLTEDKKHFQLLGFLEDKSNLQTYKTPYLNQTNAVDYSKRYPTVIGKKLGILTESGTNSPIQEVNSIVNSGYLDVVLTTNKFNAIFDDQDYLSGTGNILGNISLNSSCKRILDMGLSNGDGIYKINPSGKEFDVYCDMTTEGGGWTMLILATGSGTKFGNNSTYWKIPSYDTIAPDGPQDIEYQSEAYGTIITNNILLCYKDTTRCYNFEHNLKIPLMKFFTDNITYTKYSYNSAGFSNIGATSTLSGYYQKIGVNMTNWQCQWLGINYNRLNAASAIGAMADNDGGCTSSLHDNSALGLGLQSCGDTNGCSPGGIGHNNGKVRSTSIGSIVTGPWFVFGR